MLNFLKLVNWKVRFKDPYFVVGLVALIIMTIIEEPTTITSWEILVEQLKSFINNPYKIICTVVAVSGYIQDPTTRGFRDSNQALSYIKPKKN